MIQLWVNLPKKYKMTGPRYQTIANEDMKKIVIDNESGTITLVAGECKGVGGPAKTFSPMNIYIIELNEDGKLFVLSGEPINETIAAGDVCIMNTTKELKQAQEDFLAVNLEIWTSNQKTRSAN